MALPHGHVFDLRQPAGRGATTNWHCYPNSILEKKENWEYYVGNTC